MPDIDQLLRSVVDNGASDLHVKAGGPPTVRVNGRLAKMATDALSAADCAEAAEALMTEEQNAELREHGEVDFAYSTPGVGRFRVNIHKQRGSVAIAARLVASGAPDFKDLGLPPSVEQLANEHRGLIFVTGPTSSGKTTTTGALINHINSTRECHILTIEDPIEILHSDRLATVTQREIGQDTKAFAPALRAAMRQDPDVIFVGEVRDAETCGAALQAAETGHLVVATLHTTNVTETVNRVIDLFPPHQAKQARITLASCLAGVVCQRLLPRKGGGRVAAIEVMVMNGRTRDLLMDPSKSHLLEEVIADGDFYGMQTFDQALLKLFRAGLIELEDARSAATRPHDLDIALKQEGLQPIS